MDEWSSCIIVFLATTISFTEAISFSERPIDTIAIIGQDTQLNCSFQNRTNEPLEWNLKSPVTDKSISRNDFISDTSKHKLIGDHDAGDYSLKIFSTDIGDEGTYECIAFSAIDTDAKLVVLENDPSCRVFPGMVVVENNKIAFTCNVDKGVPPGELAWVMNGDVMSVEKNQTTHKWNYNFTRYDQAANITCKLQHVTLAQPEPSCDEDITIEVQYKPAVKVTIFGNASNTGRVIEGHSFRAKCEVQDSNPPYENITWFDRDGNDLLDEFLDFENVSRDQSGEYMCTATNTFWDGSTGSGSTVLNVSVEYSSRVVMTLSQRINITEGDTVTINCHAFTGNPYPYHMTLSVGHEIVKEEAEPEIQHTIADIKGTASGIYKCTAHTRFFDKSMTFSSAEEEIIVSYSPRIVSGDSLFEADIGEVVSMSCTANGYPTPIIKWYDGEGDVIQGDEEKRKIISDGGGVANVASTLTVTVADNSYYGIYICEADNGIPSTATQTIEIRKPGSFPVAIVAGSSAGGTVILVSILVGIICYSKNRKNDSRGKEYGGENNDGTLMRTRTPTRQEPEGLSHDINPYAESTAAPMRVTPSAEKIVTNEYELTSAPVTSGHGDATHLSGTQDVSGLYAVSSKQKTAGDRNKDATEMVLYAMPDKTRKNRKAGELNYADLDFRGNQTGQRPHRITPVEKTVYADLQTTPAKMY